jgi:hypothetical protein
MPQLRWFGEIEAFAPLHCAVARAQTAIGSARLHCDCRAYSKFLKQKLHTFEKCKYEYDKETEWAADSASRMNK